MSTQVFEKIVTQTSDPQEDLSKKAHAINVRMNWEAFEILKSKGWVVKSSKDLGDGARHYGLELVALCQYRWIPTEWVTDHHNVCGACMALAAQWISEDEG